MNHRLTSETVSHELVLSEEIKVWYRSCDFCPVLTPLPPDEVLDHALRIGNHTVKPCISDGFSGFGEEELSYDPFKLKAVVFRPEGWLLFGPRWVCPGCLDKLDEKLKEKT